VTTLQRYAKAVVALLGAVSTWGATAAAEGGIDQVEWFLLLGALGTALGVLAVPNQEPSPPPDVVEVHLPGDGGHLELSGLVTVAALAVAIGIGILLGHWLVELAG
jgi:hypothetical protein